MQKNNQNIQVSNFIPKDNPDIRDEKILKELEINRSKFNFIKSNEVWKGIIGNINKDKITPSDFKIELSPKTNDMYKKMMIEYEKRNLERMIEEEKIKQMKTEYENEKNKTKVSSLIDINCDDPDKFIKEFDNLKQKAKETNIIKKVLNDDDIFNLNNLLENMNKF